MWRNRRPGERFSPIVDRKFEATVALCDGLVRARAMRAQPGEIRAHARDVLVVATYWLNYQSLRAPHATTMSRADDNDLGQGAFQVMALGAPYLVGDARRHFDRVNQHYIE